MSVPPLVAAEIAFSFAPSEIYEMVLVNVCSFHSFDLMFLVFSFSFFFHF